MKTNNVYKTINLNRRLFNFIKDLANKQGNSFNEEIVYIVTNGLRYELVEGTEKIIKELVMKQVTKEFKPTLSKEEKDFIKRVPTMMKNNRSFEDILKVFNKNFNWAFNEKEFLGLVKNG